MGISTEDDDPFEDQREGTENAMRRLFAVYGRENTFSFAVGTLTSLVARILDLLPPLLLGIAIDSVFYQQKPFGLAFVPQGWLPTTRTGQFWLLGGLIAFAFFGGAGFHYGRNWGWNAFSQNIQHQVRTDTYDKMQRLNMDFFADKQTGEMMSVLSNDVNRLEQFLNGGMNSVFRLAAMVVGISVIMFVTNWQLAIIALLPVPLIAGFTYYFVKKIQPKYAEVRSTVGEMNSRLENNLGGIQVIKSTNTEGYESDRVDDVSQSYYDAQWGAIDLRIKFFPTLRVIAGIGFVATFVVGGFWVLNGPFGPFTGSLSPGLFVAFILYTQRFIWPMAQFGQIINMYQRARASAERIFGLMDEPSRLDQDPDAGNLTVSEGHVEYDDVSFGYESERGETGSTVENISFDVSGGDTVALVGPTGAGKSTVLKLLLRMYDVDEGEIRIDGQDIDSVTLSSLRKSIGYVSQNSYLFYGTVKENIAYGSFDATDEEIVEAAKAAEAHEFIQNLPDGYDTMAGERGVKLSGGQRQRITIARAILKDPEILVLDEATSDVDTETEMLIQRSLDRLTADRTTFAIAHRLSSIKDADQIVVLEDGQVHERGSHDALIDEDGLYANLWAVQAGEIDELPQEFIERATQRQAQTEAEAGDD
ncbi:MULTISPECIES: ABC transporter ATP-binding protein [Halococcus]|uniref:Xenobiotic-transporting ATPase n=1 Tax=Halococcus salifodinae DSM 8989 TaxID=1227456 RepID=M0MUC5_9EURY|nr:MULTISPECIES: ABC transporter ATP-binding protein [Halococcus]EMA49342.1 xenobiotic-transporting ATPase [Halococcus salifodinae DSM 8989]